MDYKERIHSMINDKQKKIQEHENSVRELRAQIQTLRDVLGLEKEKTPNRVASETDYSEQSFRQLREGSKIKKVYDLLKEKRTPMSLDDILQELGYPPKGSERSNFSGTLSHNVKIGRLFTRVAPNTFGLLEWEEQGTDSSENVSDTENKREDNEKEVFF